MDPRRSERLLFEADKRLRRIAEANNRFRRSTRTTFHSTKLNCARRLVKSIYFEMLMTMLCAFSAALVGIEVQWQVSNIGQATPLAFFALQYACAVIFVLELFLRVWAFGFMEMYCRNGLGWDHFDLLVVASIIFEVLDDAATLAMYADNTAKKSAAVGQLRIMRTLRIAKMVRIIRIHRVIRFVSPLRTLVFSIVATLKSLFWAMILLTLMMYVVGTMVTQKSIDRMAEGTTGETLCLYWCSLDNSMFTLYQAIAGGVAWRDPLESLLEDSLIMPGIFVGYVSIVYFAVLNVVTAVFCSRAIETTQKNPELGASAAIADRRTYAKNVSAFFNALDKDNRGVITLADFERAVNDEVLSAHLNTLELDTPDAWSLFRLLDADGSGLISKEEFFTGCESIKGGATGVQVAKISLEQRRMAQAMVQFIKDTDDSLRLISSRLPPDPRASKKITAPQGAAQLENTGGLVSPRGSFGNSDPCQALGTTDRPASAEHRARL